MRNNFLFYVLLCISICLIGCENSNDEMKNKLESKIFESTEPLSDFDIDLNNDGNSDFVVKYADVQINTVGGRVIFAEIEAYNENEILVNELEPKLFLRNFDDIQNEVQSPLLWVNKGWLIDLVRIELNELGDWPTEWSISSNEEFEFYYLGVKLIENSKSNSGWIKLEIDKVNGKVRVVEFYLTS